MSKLDQINPDAAEDSTLVPTALKRLLTIYRASLKANRRVLKDCLTTDGDGQTICRFCGPGIPNWRVTNGREHVSDCPVELVAEALRYNRELVFDLSTMIKDPSSFGNDDLEGDSNAG